MAVVRTIQQPSTEFHGDELVELLQVDWANEFLLSSAYLNSAGAASLRNVLETVGVRCRAYIGIRNGATTAQGIAGLLKAGVRVYAVDTATRLRIFHSKVYLARGEERATVIIGSANLTYPGLFNNIESGAHLSLDLDNLNDRLFLERLEQGFQNLQTNFPEHCFQVTSGREIVILMRQGLLEDEREPKASGAMGVGRQGSQQSKRPIGLPLRVGSARTGKRKAARRSTTAPASSVPHYGPLAWEKPRLPRTDLQLLNVGNDPGVLRLTQARFTINGVRIDQTRYFRTTVFQSLQWVPDPAGPQKEMTQAKFSLVIGGIYLGDFTLQLSYKPSWEAGQGNYTTGLHWGAATQHIRKEHLVGRGLRIFYPAIPGNAYILEID
jgi:HKD family nuclease